MSLDHVFTLANDSEFRTLVSFTGPPRAGRVLEQLANGQLRIEMDDPDGGDVLAWPLNGAEYAPKTIVYCLFAANSPDSAIVIGAKGSTPTITPLLRTRQLHVGASDTTPHALLVVGDDLGSFGGHRISVGNAAGTAAINLGSDHDRRAYLLWNDLYRRFAFGMRLAGATYDTLVIDRDRLGIGLPVSQAPFGTLHAQGSAGGLLFWSEAAVGATPAVIIPDGAGDVTGLCLFWAVVQVGVETGAVQTQLAPGGTRDHAAANGVWRFRVTTSGQFDVVRTQGTATAQITLLALWN